MSAQEPSGFETPATRADIAKLALALTRLEAKIEARFDQESAKMSAFRSDMLAAAEGAVVEAQKVDRDQLYTRDRLDKIERRLTALESARRRQK